MPPPPPPGFVLDQGTLPPPPPGFTLDRAEETPLPPMGWREIYAGLTAANPGAPVDPRPALLTAGLVAGTAGAMAAPPGVAAALSNPWSAGLLTGAMDYAVTRDPLHAARAGLEMGVLSKVGGALAGGKAVVGASRSLTARLLHTIARAAATEAPAVAEAAPAAAAVYRGIPSLMKIGGAVEQDAAAAATAARAAQGAESAAGVLKAAPRAAQVASEAATAAPAAAAPAVEAAGAGEGALATRLRASALLKSNPKALADELEGKVLSLKTGIGKGLSSPQLAKVIEEQYGIPAGPAEKMVDMIFTTHGLK